MGQVLGRVLGTDPERSKTVCFHEVDVQKPSVGQGRCSQNGSYFDGMGSRARKPRLGRQRRAPGLHSGPKKASGAGWLAPALEGRRGIRQAGRRGAAWVKSPRPTELLRVTASVRRCGRRPRSDNGPERGVLSACQAPCQRLAGCWAPPGNPSLFSPH